MDKANYLGDLCVLLSGLCVKTVFNAEIAEFFADNTATDLDAGHSHAWHIRPASRHTLQTIITKNRTTAGFIDTQPPIEAEIFLSPGLEPVPPNTPHLVTKKPQTYSVIWISSDLLILQLHRRRNESAEKSGIFGASFALSRLLLCFQKGRSLSEPAGL